jgi:hypothetical protein
MRRAPSLALAALVLVAVPSAASTLMVGVHAGATIPNLRDNGGNELSSGWSSRVGAFFGASLRAPIRDAWSAQIEANYSAQGGKRDGWQATDGSAFGVPGGFVYADYKHESRLDYLEIPLLLRFDRPGDTAVHLLAGPYAGILLSAKEITSGSSDVYAEAQRTTLVAPGVPFDATTDIKSDVRSLNWGVQVGVGASRPAGRGTVSLDVRGGLGLTDIQKDAANGKNTTGALVVAMGYAMPVRN